MPFSKTHAPSWTSATKVEVGDYIEIGGALAEVIEEPRPFYDFIILTVEYPEASRYVNFGIGQMDLKFHPGSVVKIWTKRRNPDKV